MFNFLYWNNPPYGRLYCERKFYTFTVELPFKRILYCILKSYLEHATPVNNSSTTSPGTMSFFPHLGQTCKSYSVFSASGNGMAIPVVRNLCLRGFLGSPTIQTFYELFFFISMLCIIRLLPYFGQNLLLHVNLIICSWPQSIYNHSLDHRIPEPFLPVLH